MRPATPALVAAGFDRAAALDPLDRVFALLAVEAKLVAASALAPCIERPLAAAAVLRGLLSADQVSALLETRSRLALQCAPCNEAWIGDESVAGAAVPCPICRATLTRRSLAETTALSDPEADLVARVAARIRKVRVRGFVARGAMGAVFRAEHPDLGRTVALKVLNEELGTPAMVDRFRTEALAAARLDHPNIVRVLDAGTEGGLHFVVMQFVEGVPFEEIVEKRGRDLTSLLRLLEKVARAIEHAHSKGVVHRDLKPGNILVAGDEPFVLDFGLARLMDDALAQTRSGARLGTPYYMSPEQVAGRRVGPPADVHALGVTLYRILTGRFPYEAGSVDAIYEKIASSGIILPRRHNPSVHRDLEIICLRALEKEPRHRTASAGAFADDLRRFLDGEPIHARPVSLPVRLWRGTLRRPAIAVTVLLALVAASAGFAWLAARRALDREQAAALDMIRENAPALVELALDLRRRGHLRDMRPVRELLEKTHARAAARAPGLAEIDYWMGRMHRALMEEDRALEFQERALRKEPSFAPALYERAILNSRRYGDLFRAADRRLRARRGASLALVDAASARALPDPTPAEVEADAPQLAALRLAVARDLEAIAASPLPPALRTAAQAIAKHRLGADARELLAEAVRLDSGLEEVYEALGETGSADDRLRWCEEAVRRDAGYRRHWLALGDLFERRGNEPKAVEAYSKAIDLDGESGEAWHARGAARLRQLQRLGGSERLLDEAAADFERAAQLWPSRLEPLIGAGQVHATRADRRTKGGDPVPEWDAAERIFSKAVELDADHADGWLYRATARTNRGLWGLILRGDDGGDFDRAEPDFAQALRLNPRDADAWHGRATLRSNRATLRMTRHEDPEPDFAGALADLREALRLNPKRALDWVSIGIVHTAAAAHRAADPAPSWTAAEEAFGKAIDIEPTLADAWARRATVRFLRKDAPDLPGAVSDWEQAIRLDPRLRELVAPRLKEAKSRIR